MISSKLISNTDIILNSILTHIIILDNDLHIVYANAAAQQLLTRCSRKFQGSYFADLFDYLSLDIELMQATINQGQGFTDNEVNLVINEQLFIVSLTAQSINQTSILLEIIRLDNQKKLSQEQLQQAQQIAARDLVRGLAHEIKNPLSGLRGAAQLLAHELPNQHLQEYTQIIIEQADRLRHLVDKLLGPQQLAQQSVTNIHQAIEQVYKLLTFEKNSNIEIIRDYDPSLPELQHDADQIEQVILNICRNALQALEETGGIITIRTRTAFQVTLKGKRYRLCAQIDIEDTGSGIPASLQDILFYPMVSGREGGSGLGLSIARHLVDQHYGKIEFNSWPGHTVFTIYLPIRQ